MTELLTTAGLYAHIREAFMEAGSQTLWAREHGISPSLVSDVVNARREPTPAMLAALGLRKVTRYQVLATPQPTDGASDAA